VLGTAALEGPRTSPGYASKHRCACRVVFCQNLSIMDQTGPTPATAAAASTGNDDDYAAFTDERLRSRWRVINRTLS